MGVRRGSVIGLIAGVLIAFGAVFFLIDTGIRVDALGTSPTAAEQLTGFGGLLVGTVLTLTFFVRLLVSPKDDTPASP